ncbi:hypothetical protein ACOCG7_21165 [Paraburkholderia sp. DD10]|jgi:hypothetical protein|uniref:Cation transporter n=1 Tax=Paraburkholderia terricola TaxID=169427 RepID=A0ABU1LY83_9BURK|nr:hypothetical protein [Paraburkholderia terricola]MDR6411708.1 hypothetical protein [Paraburkholderia terricola]MDR6484009.1 hypothetical protein [Paraburkholderia terricola]MDR6493971.1 hypothetical protein [Paraburkholderia terricola]
MITTQRITVSAALGALHVIAIWKCLRACETPACGSSMHVKLQDRTESITLYFDDVPMEQLHRLVIMLNNLPGAMTASLAPATAPGPGESLSHVGSRQHT